MQFHSCVGILGHAEPQNWFDPGVKVVVFQYIWLKNLFGTVVNYIFWHFILTFLLKNTRLSIKKKKEKKKANPCFPIFWAVQKRANKHPFFRPCV